MSRKVFGFVGHNAYHACSKCLKAFPTEKFGEKADFTGTDRTLWPPRNFESHRKHALEYKSAHTKEQKEIECNYGCHYSILQELPYYDIIRFCVIDPMHNLLLGTGKHILTVWKALGIIDKHHLSSIQDIVDGFVTPEIGRIPSTIASGFTSFTAEQWKNCILVSSLCSLKGIIPHHHYNCWLLFVKAASLLCQRRITLNELKRADELLIEFCSTFEAVYGKQ